MLRVMCMHVHMHVTPHQDATRTMEAPSSSSTAAPPVCAPLLDPSGSLSSNISRCGLRRERAAILEPTEVHREVLPSSAAMARALGFRCVTVLHKTPKREHGIFGPMKEWGLAPTCSTARPTTCATCARCRRGC